MQQCRSLLLDLITVSSSRRFPSSGCQGGSLLPKLLATGDSTPQVKPTLRRILQLLLLHPVTGELAGAETIVEAVAAHNPFAVQRPEFVQQVVVEETDPARSSLLVVDNRDERIISPFQNWLVEIICNAASSINVLTEWDQVMPPNSGYHCSLFVNYTRGQEGHVLSGTPMQARLSRTLLFSLLRGLSCSTPRPPMWM